MNRQLPSIALVSLISIGCAVGTPARDAGGTQTGTDAGMAVDAGSVDAGNGADTGPGQDAGAVDSGGADSGVIDAGRSDAGPTDAGPTDAGPIDAGPRVITDTCAQALNVTAGGTWADLTTVGAVDDYSMPLSGDGCTAGGSFSGGDLAYFVQPSVATTYHVVVTPTRPDDENYDPMLYALLNCDFSQGCHEATIFNGPDVFEQITFDAAAGQRIWIVVDGESGSEGSFDLLVEVNP